MNHPPKSLSQMISDLLAPPNREFENPPMPSYLWGINIRRASAFSLAERYPQEPQGIAALIFAAFRDESDEVQLECLRALTKTAGSQVDYVYIALIHERDEVIRLAALECLAVVNSPLKRVAANLLQDDDDEDVRSLARQILNDDPDFTRWEV